MTTENGTIEIVEFQSRMEEPNRAKLSKRTVVNQTIIDLSGTVNPDDVTLYRRYNQLTKLVSKQT